MRLLRLSRLLRLFLRLPRVAHGGSVRYGLNVEAFFAGCGFGIVIVLIVIVLSKVIFLRVIFLWIFFLRIFEVFVLPDVFAEQGLVHAATAARIPISSWIRCVTWSPRPF